MISYNAGASATNRPNNLNMREVSRVYEQEQSP